MSHWDLPRYGFFEDDGLPNLTWRSPSPDGFRVSRHFDVEEPRHERFAIFDFRSDPSPDFDDVKEVSYETFAVYDSVPDPAPDPAPNSAPDTAPEPVLDVTRHHVTDLEDDETYQEPRVYQQTAIGAINGSLNEGCLRVGVSAPTGAGKTIIFANVVRDTLHKHPNGRVIVLVDSQEQATQAENKLEEVCGFGSIKLDHERSIRRANKRANVIIASVATLRMKKRMDEFKNRFKIGDFKLVVVDEAHHSPANSHLQILSEFNEEVELEHSTVADRSPTHGYRIPILGVSATFTRNDNRKLSWVYEKLAYECSLEDLWKGEYLVPVKVWSLSQEFRDISSPNGIVRIHDCLVPPRARRAPASNGTPETLDELSLREIEQLAATEKSNQQVLRYYQGRPAGRKSTLVFSKDIRYVENLVKVMVDAGIQARSVISASSAADRQANTAAFSKGDCAVLVTCLALAEGYDAPHIDCIILAKPTDSHIKHTQMIGRGTRPSPETGKTDCLVIDLVGNCDRFPLGVDPSLDGKKKKRKSQKKKATGT